MGFTNVMTGNPVKSNLPQYETLPIAVNTALVWPVETMDGTPYVAAEIDVTATAVNLNLAMPDARASATGIVSIISNVGANQFTLTDNLNNQIVQIAAGTAWLIILADNSTQAGVWRAIQLGSTVSNAVAGALAGPGIQANGAQLQTSINSRFVSATGPVLAADRATAIVWNGGAGTLQLDSIVNLTQSWWCIFRNEGSGNVQISTSGGQTIDGASGPLTLVPGQSIFFIANTPAAGFVTAGGITLPIPVAAGGTGSQTPTQALINLGAGTTGLSIFEASTAASVIALLGLQSSLFTESSVSTNQTLSAGSTQTVFVCTAALTINLPLTTTLSKNFVFLAYAQGGAVTLTPNVADKINNGGAGANFTINPGTSAFVVTDANGNWWPLFTTTGGTVTSVALSAPAEFTVSGSPVTTNGTLAFAKANQNAGTVWAGPVPGAAAAAPTFRALVNEETPRHGECKLVFVDATHVKLVPAFGGDHIIINGVLFNIPSAGITAAANSTFLNGVGAQALVALTTYDVCLFNNGGTLTLDFVTTGHMTDTTAGNVGVEVRNNGGIPDSSRTLVAKVRVVAGAQFGNNTFGTSTDNLLIINWFNRRPLSLQNINTSSVAVSFSFPGSVSSNNGSFLTWGDCPVHGVASALVENSTNGDGALISCGIDGVSFGDVTETEIATGGIPACISANGVLNAAEGFHTFQVIGGALPAGSLATYFNGDTAITLTGIWG